MSCRLAQHVLLASNTHTCAPVRAQVREIWLSSEDTGAYGRDIGSSLPALLRQLVEVLPPGGLAGGIDGANGRCSRPAVLGLLAGVQQAKRHCQRGRPCPPAGHPHAHPCLPAPMHTRHLPACPPAHPPQTGAACYAWA